MRVSCFADGRPRIFWTSVLKPAGYSKPDQPGRNLHVEQPLRQPLDGLEAELHFAAAGMDHGLVAGGDDGLPKGPHVADGHGVDHGQPSRGRHLDQAEHGPIGMLGDELGVEGDGLRGGQFPAVVAQLRRRW